MSGGPRRRGGFTGAGLPLGRRFTCDQRCQLTQPDPARSLTVTGASQTSYPSRFTVPAAAVTAAMEAAALEPPPP